MFGGSLVESVADSPFNLEDFRDVLNTDEKISVREGDERRSFAVYKCTELDSLNGLQRAVQFSEDETRELPSFRFVFDDREQIRAAFGGGRNLEESHQ